MKYPDISAAPLAADTISEFYGINRLPRSGAGEFYDMENLTNEDFPVLSSAGFSAGVALKIYNDSGELENIDAGKIGEICEYGENGEITGVYNGDFYYKGKLQKYADGTANSMKIKPEDSVEIERVGTQYIIMCQKADNSVFFSFDPENAALGEEGAVLYTTERNFIEGRDDVYIFHNWRQSGDFRDFAEATGKAYYIIFTENQTGCEFMGRLMRGTQLNFYANGRGNTVTPPGLLKTDNQEHSDRFIVDFARGQQESYSFGFYSDFLNAEAKNMGVSRVGVSEENSYSAPCEAANPTYVSTSHILNTEFRKGAAIAGHFEYWDAEKSRYVPYSEADINNGIKPFYVTNSSGAEMAKYYYDGAVHYSYTAVNLRELYVSAAPGKRNRMAAYKNRIFTLQEDGGAIYASALEDYTNFNDFSGLSTDSWYVKILSSGKFSAICEYAGQLLCFKRDRIIILYGDTPDDFALSRDIVGVGCIADKSICEVGGVLYFLGADGIYRFAGGMPERISRKLNRRYTDAAAWSDDGRYFIRALCGGVYETLCYNPDTQTWTRYSLCGEFHICAKEPSADAVIYRFTREQEHEWDSGVQDIDWSCTIADITDGTFDEKAVEELYIRARLNGSARVSVYSADGTITSQYDISDSKTTGFRAFRIPVRAGAGDRYSINISGHGSVLIYAVERVRYAGGRTR